MGEPALPQPGSCLLLRTSPDERTPGDSNDEGLSQPSAYMVQFKAVFHTAMAFAVHALLPHAKGLTPGEQDTLKRFRHSLEPLFGLHILPRFDLYVLESMRALMTDKLGICPDVGTSVAYLPFTVKVKHVHQEPLTAVAEENAPLGYVTVGYELPLIGRGGGVESFEARVVFVESQKECALIPILPIRRGDVVKAFRVLTPFIRLSTPKADEQKERVPLTIPRIRRKQVLEYVNTYLLIEGTEKEPLSVAVVPGALPSEPEAQEPHYLTFPTRTSWNKRFLRITTLCIRLLETLRVTGRAWNLELVMRHLQLCYQLLFPGSYIELSELEAGQALLKTQQLKLLMLEKSRVVILFQYEGDYYYVLNLSKIGKEALPLAMDARLINYIDGCQLPTDSQVHFNPESTSQPFHGPLKTLNLTMQFYDLKRATRYANLWYCCLKSVIIPLDLIPTSMNNSLLFSEFSIPVDDVILLLPHPAPLILTYGDVLAYDLLQQCALSILSETLAIMDIIVDDTQIGIPYLVIKYVTFRENDTSDAQQITMWMN